MFMPFTVGPNHILMNRQYYDPHFTEEETEAQRAELTCRRSHKQSVALLGLEPRPVWPQSPRSQWEGVYIRASAVPEVPALRPPISPSPTWTATPPPVTATRRRLPAQRRPHRHGGVSFRLRAGHAPPAPPLISSGGAPGKRGQGAGVPKWAGAEAAEGQEITDSKGWLTCLVARELRPGKLSSWEDWVRASRASPALLETGTL